MGTLVDDCFAPDSRRMRHGDVLALLAARLEPVTGERSIAVMDARGRVAAEDIVSPIAVPQSDNAAVDGFAFANGAHLAAGGTLQLAGRVAAGDRPGRLAPGRCMRIFTGAPMPQGADTVAMQEDCAVHPREPDRIVIPQGLKPGANRRLAGEDFGTGDRIVARGDVLRPQDLAALAATGHSTIAVRSRLRIGVLSTGDEIVEPDAGGLGPAQVHDANRPMLLSLAASPRAVVSDLGLLRDDPALLRRTLAEAARGHDLIITSGGASRGEADHMHDVLGELGTCHLWQIAIKPGRPMLFGRIGDTVLVGLPGNPVAALVCFAVYVQPMIGHLCGADVRPPTGYDLPAAFEIGRKKTGRREFLRAWTAIDPQTGALSAHKFSRDGSGLISGLQAAQGLIELDEDVAHVGRGDPVRFVPFAEMGLCP
ncbi:MULTISPECIES: gephyrin-like molybdotransferase Glp [unclassified Roseitalea]|uniref:molybdopterin molybdotransferase MoeA n=1 Tax=unclassified Roseitalea TaxID=2639107 RepID=UPI00273E65D2|nr:MULTISPECIES: gephyrin-like molybdotransferase Glp [unclassified Roseitalea]